MKHIYGRFIIHLYTPTYGWGVHYKGYARKGMAIKVAEEQKRQGYCLEYWIEDREENKNGD